MISLHILDIKNFMAQLLLRESFDRFYLAEATINTFASFYMDGHLQKDYYTSEELETTEEYRQPGSSTVKKRKNRRRPHKACIFLSNFFHLDVVFVVYMCYNRFEVIIP